MAPIVLETKVRTHLHHLQGYEIFSRTRMRFKLFLETDERKLRYLRRVTDYLNIDPRLFIATTILIERDFIEKSKKAIYFTQNFKFVITGQFYTSCWIEGEILKYTASTAEI